MFPFSTFGSLVLLATLLSSCALAHPSPALQQQSSRGTHKVGRRGLQVETYHPAPVFETYGALGRRLVKRSMVGESLESRARFFLEAKANLTRSCIEYHSGFALDGIEHAYLHQVHNGIPFVNAVANVAFKEFDDSVLSYGSSFVNPHKIAPSKPAFDVKSAIEIAEKMLDGDYNQRFRLAYLARPDNSAILVYAIHIRNEEANTFYEAFVDAHTGELASLTNFVAGMAYRVVPIQRASFAEGQEMIVNPEDLTASPYGWHENRTMMSAGTAGNNIVTHVGTSLLDGTSASFMDDEWKALIFDYPYSASAAATTDENLDAARVNAFYVGNIVHDLAWKYGFRPLTFNFQADTITDQWARGDDPINIRVQTTPGSNDATCTVPPDGTPSVCKLYVWNKSSPTRDVSLANDVLVHELGHGISGRLTGGGTAACLQTLEARGLGEGWSDALAEWTEQKSAVITDYVIGAWINNNPAGLRTYPYSTSAVTNPLRYSSVAGQTTHYPIGEVWANILHNVYAALVAMHGWSASAFTDPDTTHGNVVFLRLFFDGLSIQPCNPTFTAARDAWIQADLNRYGGSHKCLLWTAFASRGLGVNAGPGYIDDSTVPAGC